MVARSEDIDGVGEVGSKDDMPRFELAGLLLGLRAEERWRIREKRLRCVLGPSGLDGGIRSKCGMILGVVAVATGRELRDAQDMSRKTWKKRY